MTVKAIIEPVFERCPSEVDAAAFVRVADTIVAGMPHLLCVNGKKPLTQKRSFERAKLLLKPICPSCAAPVFSNDDLGARGVRPIVDADSHREASFSHYKDTPDKDCVLYRPNDPRFVGIIHDHEFSAKERARNTTALEKLGVSREINAVQEFLIYHLISTDISGEDRAELRRIEKKLLSIKGLADNLWYLPLASVVALGARIKEKDGKRLRREYALRGSKIGYPCSSSDMSFIVRSRLEMCQSRSDGGYPHPLPDKKGKPIAFDATPEFVESIVVDVLGVSKDCVSITEFQHREQRAREWQAEEFRRRAAQRDQVLPTTVPQKQESPVRVLLFPELPRHFGQVPHLPKRGTPPPTAQGIQSALNFGGGDQ